MDIEKQGKNKDLHFEDFRQDNDIPYWYGRDLMQMLGYKDFRQFKNVINKASKVFISLSIPIEENIKSIEREKEGRKVSDYKLTRFACYLIVMNADPKKEEVAKAQLYFAYMTRQFEIMIENREDIERLVIRDDIKEGNKSLSEVVRRHGVEDYSRFMNAGYLGLYNMYNWELAKKRNIDKKNLYDYMGRTELAANLFRISLTEERIEQKNIQGQRALEATHIEIGRKIRDLVKENTGKNPEDLPVRRRLPEVKKELKKGYKKMLKEEKNPDIDNNR